MNSVDIKYHWADVQSSQGIPYRYPDKPSDYMKGEYSRPSVYRWEVRSQTLSLLALYIGETDNLARRVEQCISPGKSQMTNLYLKAYFDDAVKRGDRVELKVMDFGPFQINKVTVSKDLLGRTHVRRMLENLVLVELEASISTGPPIILNRVFTRDMERRRKRVDEALAGLKKLGLSVEQTRRVIQALQVGKTKG